MSKGADKLERLVAELLTRCAPCAGGRWCTSDRVDRVDVLRDLRDVH